MYRYLCSWLEHMLFTYVDDSEDESLDEASSGVRGLGNPHKQDTMRPVELENTSPLDSEYHSIVNKTSVGNDTLVEARRQLDAAESKLNDVLVAKHGAEMMYASRLDGFSKSQVKLLTEASKKAAVERTQAQARLELVLRLEDGGGGGEGGRKPLTSRNESDGRPRGGLPTSINDTVTMESAPALSLGAADRHVSRWRANEANNDTKSEFVSRLTAAMKSSKLSKMQLSEDAPTPRPRVPTLTGDLVHTTRSPPRGRSP